MANSTDEDVGKHRVTTGTAKKRPSSTRAQEQANFIRAVSICLNDLEVGRELAFDDAVIRLGLIRNEVPSWLDTSEATRGGARSEIARAD